MFKDKFDLYIKVEGVYPEIGNHDEHLNGEAYVRHFFVKKEDHVSYNLNVSYTPDKTSDEVIEKLFFMASTFK